MMQHSWVGRSCAERGRFQTLGFLQLSCRNVHLVEAASRCGGGKGEQYFRVMKNVLHCYAAMPRLRCWLKLFLVVRSVCELCNAIMEGRKGKGSGYLGGSARAQACRSAAPPKPRTWSAFADRLLADKQWMRARAIHRLFEGRQNVDSSIHRLVFQFSEDMPKRNCNWDGHIMREKRPSDIEDRSFYTNISARRRKAAEMRERFYGLTAPDANGDDFIADDFIADDIAAVDGGELQGDQDNVVVDRRHAVADGFPRDPLPAAASSTPSPVLTHEGTPWPCACLACSEVWFAAGWVCPSYYESFKSWKPPAVKRNESREGHPSKALIPDLTQLLNGISFTRIVEFLGGALARELWVWRSLSHSSQKIAQVALLAQKTVNSVDWRLTDAATQHLANCAQLQIVNLQYCVNLTDTAALHLARCKQLETVDFGFCRELTDAAAEHVAQCPLLRKVNFGGCGQLTDAAARHLARCPQLQDVNFLSCRQLISDTAAQYLAQCSQLKVVNFCYFSRSPPSKKEQSLQNILSLRFGLWEIV